MALEHSQRRLRIKAQKRARAGRLTPAGRPLVVGPRLVLTTALLGGGLYLAWSLKTVLITLLFAVVLAFIGDPLVKRLAARGVPRAAGTALYLAGLFLFLVGLSLLVVPTLVRELGELVARLPAAAAALESWVETTLGVHIPRDLSELSARVSDDMLQQAADLVKGNTKAVKSGAAGLFSAASGAIGAAGQTFLVPVLTFFVLVELPELKQFGMGLLPAGRRAAVADGARAVGDALQRLLRGQLLVALAMALIYAVGLSVFGVPLALAIAIIAGFGYLIPFASPTLCVVLSAVFVLLEVQDGVWWPLLGAVVTAMVVQLLEGWVLTPRIVGESAGLSPLAVILSVLVFGNLFGFLGVLFALPMATTIGVLLARRNDLASAGVVLETA